MSTPSPHHCRVKGCVCVGRGCADAAGGSFPHGFCLGAEGQRDMAEPTGQDGELAFFSSRSFWEKPRGCPL